MLKRIVALSTVAALSVGLSVSTPRPAHAGPVVAAVLITALLAGSLAHPGVSISRWVYDR